MYTIQKYCSQVDEQAKKSNISRLYIPSQFMAWFGCIFVVIKIVLSTIYAWTEGNFTGIPQGS